MAHTSRCVGHYALAAGEGERAGAGDGAGTGLAALGANDHDVAMLACLQDGEDTGRGQHWQGAAVHDDGLLTASPSDTRVTTGARTSTGGGAVKAALSEGCFLTAVAGGRSPSSTARAPMNGELSPTTPAPRRKKAPRHRQTRTAPTARETRTTPAPTASRVAPPAGLRTASPRCFSAPAATWRLLGTGASMRKGPRCSAASTGTVCCWAGEDEDADDVEVDDAAMDSGMRELAVGPREPRVLGTARRVSTTREALWAGPGLESDTSSTWKHKGEAGVSQQSERDGATHTQTLPHTHKPFPQSEASMSECVVHTLPTTITL